MIYLDHNATAPLLPEVARAMAECYAAGHGNPASLHQSGRRARQIVEDCREAIARMLGADLEGRHPDRLIFTSGGTEANNLAIFGLAGDAPGTVAVSTVEHPSITAPAEELRRRGFDVQRLPVSRHGVVELAAIDSALRSQPRIVSVMLANNETGAIQPVAEIAERCRRAGVRMHTDAVQGAGLWPLDFRALGIATMTVSAHKLHGPVGIGALVVGYGVELRPSLFGGSQQGAARPGTESIALVVGLHKALEIARRERTERAARIVALRNRFEQRLLAECPEVIVHAVTADRLPHVSNVAFVGADRQAMLIALDRAGVACSAGSACSSGSTEPSPTLLAMGCPKHEVESSLRF
ncbi:MAG TPA: cysteine desulfurase family protein, partial [Pirellulales bacterium]|nr:cysteine desulfurase family protein [Pirellulales bacterium]